MFSLLFCDSSLTIFLYFGYALRHFPPYSKKSIRRW